MKILLVIDSLDSGGAQRQLINLAIGLKKHEHNVEILTYFPECFYEEIIHDNNIKLTNILVASKIRRLLEIRRYIRRGNFNAVISFMVRPSFICEISGLPHRIWTLVIGERGSPGFSYEISTKIMRLFHFLADSVVSNSNAKIEDTLKGSPFLKKRNCHIIYNYVDLNEWKCKPKESASGGKMKVVVAATHNYNKNGMSLIKALHLLSKNEKEKLNIEWYGRGLEMPSKDDYVNEMMALIDEYSLQDTIKLLPAEKNIREKYEEADVIGLFSLWEGLPNTICEGMACGKPILASAISDIPLLIENGVSGFLFDPKFGPE